MPAAKESGMDYLCVECNHVHRFGQAPEVISHEDDALQGAGGGSLGEHRLIHGGDAENVPNVEEHMLREGWMKINGQSWSNEILSCGEMVVPGAGRLKRRVTRDGATGDLVEDLWVDIRTPDRLLRRSLRRPRHLKVEVELANKESEVSWEEAEMSPRDATQYRAVAARLNFLSCDRPDVQYACKEATRRMATPVNGDWSLLKRVGRYLLGSPRVVHCYKWQSWPAGITVFVDSNLAGCTRTRKSTTGVCIMHGGHLLRSFSRTQSNIALSSAEAELYAMVASASEGLGARAMCLDYGCSAVDITLHVDASAAIGVAQRKGLGKLRHLNTQALWIQDAVRERRVVLEKVAGTENPADLMTKHLDRATLDKLIEKMNLKRVEGRSAMAPQLTTTQASTSTRTPQDKRHEEVNHVDVCSVDCIDTVDFCSVDCIDDVSNMLCFDALDRVDLTVLPCCPSIILRKEAPTPLETGSCRSAPSGRESPSKEVVLDVFGSGGGLLS